MHRPTLFVLAAALATAALLPITEPAQAGRGDSLAGAAKSYRKAFKRDAKEAEKEFADVVGGLTKGLNSGATSAEDAVTRFGNALSFYASKLHTAAADASLGFAGDAVQAMSSDGDPSLPGAAAGDGGSLDSFAESIRGDLAKFRAKAVKRTSKFRKAFDRADDQRGGLRVSFEDWTFTPRPAPDTGGALGLIPEPVRLWGAVAARLQDGRIFVTAFGSAAPERAGTFDVRIVRGTFQVKPIGDYIRDGGMDVNADAWWTHTGAINDPFVGDTVSEGNAQIHFGMDPAGDEPQRLEHAGLLSIP